MYQDRVILLQIRVKFFTPPHLFYKLLKAVSLILRHR